MSRIIMHGNKLYEIDEKCMEEKRRNIKNIGEEKNITANDSKIDNKGCSNENIKNN